MNQGCTHRIEVARRVDGATQLLGRHVPERADQRGAVGYSFQSTSGSEVHQRERPLAPAQDVRRLHVAVHDAAVMQVAEDLEHLTCDGSSLHFVDDMGLHAFGERFPIHQLLRDIQPQRRTFALPKGFDQPRDLWMRDGAEQLRFAVKGIELLRGRDQAKTSSFSATNPVGPSARYVLPCGVCASTPSTRYAPARAAAPQAAQRTPLSRAKHSGQAEASAIN